MTQVISDLSMDDKQLQMKTQLTRVADVSNLEVECSRYVNLALLYLYRKAACEVKHFCKKEIWTKLSFEYEGLLLSKGRLLDCMNFQETGELRNLTLEALGIRTRLPLIERFSPLAYSIAEYVHWNIARHRGVETCTRISGENISIIQAPTLYRELGDDCMVCAMKRKRFLQVEMGPASEHQLTLAPPFWTCQVDLFGPITVTVPGFERETRNRRVLEAKCWVMTTVCPTTRLVNLQVMESSKAAGWIDAFTRLSCEVGCPSLVFCDRDSAGMSGFDIGEFEIRDLQLALHRERGIKFELCSVSGHDKHGHVERVIRSIQESFEDSGMKNKILHATGLQTVCKLVESQYNNLPIGYHYGRDADNTPLLRIITPNFLRVGRVNKRSLDGPIKLPANRMDILNKVDETYEAWFKIWRETLVPKLMNQPKWFRSDRDLDKGDLVYFKKRESQLDGKWIVGIVDEVKRGRDGKIREVNVRYHNYGENQSRITSRTVRQLVKLWSLEDQHLVDDLEELGKRLRRSDFIEEAVMDTVGEPDVGTHATDGEPDSVSVHNNLDQDGEPDVGTHATEGDPKKNLVNDDAPAANTRSKRKKCSRCCCVSHHRLAAHGRVSDEKNLDMELAVEEDVHPLIIALFSGEDWYGMKEEDVLGDLLLSVGINLNL